MAYRLALSAAALLSAASAQIMGDDTMMPDDDTPHNSGSKWSMDYEALGGTVSTAVIDIYPGYEGEFSIGGWVTVADLGEQQGCIDCTGPTGGLVLKAGLFGLESSAIGGLHVHAGTNCDSPDGPGEHYVQDGQEDIWNDGMQWESDGNGDATVYHELSEYTLPTSGRAVVIHLSDGTRAGCGVLKGAASATIGTYPGYTGMQYVGGTVVVSEWDCGIDVDAELTGLEPKVEGGMHIHEGSSCDDPDGPGEHYFADDEDPWNSEMVYESDREGEASVFYHLKDYALPVTGRVVVVHLEDGTRAGCGVFTGNAIVGCGAVYGEKSSSSSGGGEDEGIGAGAIVGIILAIGVLLVCMGAFFFCRGEKRDKKKKPAGFDETKAREGGANPMTQDEAAKPEAVQA